jgi:YVTN family beta-propeller protein
MKQIKLNYFFFALAFTAILASCHKDKITPNSTPTAQRAGLYILNQGDFGSNNSTITYYDYTSKVLTPDIFFSANNSPLGDTGNDLEIYGSKMFIIVNNSDLIDVVNATGSKLIKSITLYQPRSVVFYKNDAFVTSYNGTVSVIDTTSLTITKTITVGNNPEQMAISNGKLYVANSDGYNVTSATTTATVSVIDLTALTVSKTISGVLVDPVSVAADTYGNIYVLSLGNFAAIGPGMTIISSTSDAVTSTTSLNLAYNIPITVSNGFAYYFTADNKIAVYNTKTQTTSQANFITDGTTITTPYAITVDDISGEVFVADAKDYTSNGTLFAFDKTGKEEYTITTGINPGKITLVNK